jgi:hypothetical protein
MEISEPRLRNLLRQAERNAENGKLAAAETLYRQIIDEAPEVDAAWVGLAAVLANPAEKRAAYEQALALNPHNTAALAALSPTDTASAPPAVAPAEEQLRETITEREARPRPDAGPGGDAAQGAAQGAAQEAAQEAAGQAMAEAHELFCYRHPDRATSLRCYNCNRPICIRCANKTPVGYICPECMREAEDTFFNSRPLDYLIAAAVSLPLSILVGWLLIYVLAGRLGFFYLMILFFISGAVGGFIGRITKRAIGNRRGRYLPQLVVAMMVLGVLLPAIPIFIAVLMGQAGALFALIGPAIYLFVGGGAAYWQMR